MSVEKELHDLKLTLIAVVIMTWLTILVLAMQLAAISK